LWTEASCGFIAAGAVLLQPAIIPKKLLNSFPREIGRETLSVIKGRAYAMHQIKSSGSEPHAVLCGCLCHSRRQRKGGHIMASNFRILMHQSGESLSLKLSGDFDGTSAFELLHVLKEKGHGVQSLIIDTNNLNRVYPFGQGILEKRLSELGSDGQKLLFTGDKADLISP
jgi:anti-anti-sigma regulatory factor